MMFRFYPMLTWSVFRRVGGMAVVGALLAGVFGVVHDQVSFTVGPEYYERMKFDQFAYADIGQTGRWLVAQIGVMATWWVGFLGGWFLARVGGGERGWKDYLRSLIWVMAGAGCASGLGAWIGPRWFGRSQEWSDTLLIHGVTDAERFNRVAGMHTGAYVGALLALVLVMLGYRMRVKGSALS